MICRRESALTKKQADDRGDDREAAEYQRGRRPAASATAGSISAPSSIVAMIVTRRSHDRSPAMPRSRRRFPHVVRRSRPGCGGRPRDCPPRPCDEVGPTSAPLDEDAAAQHAAKMEISEPPNAKPTSGGIAWCNPSFIRFGAHCARRSGTSRAATPSRPRADHQHAGDRAPRKGHRESLVQPVRAPRPCARSSAPTRSWPM